MRIDLSDPASIRAWLALRPKRHGAQLLGLLALYPQFRESIEEAMK